MRFATIALAPLLAVIPVVPDAPEPVLTLDDPLVKAMNYQERVEDFIERVEARIEARKERRQEARQASRAAERAALPAPSTTSVAGLPDPWDDLAACESGGNPAINTGNGYYGLFQFSLSTWQSVGGVGLPSEASVAEQLHRAQILQARSGWGQWPVCAAGFG